MSPPLTTFHGFVKQLNSSQLEPLQRGALAYAFSRFLEAGESRVDDQSELTKEELSLVESMKATKKTIFRVGRGRRFAGGDDLPPNRYFTICHSPLGDDDSSLLNELNWYQNIGHSGYTIVLDFAYESCRNFETLFNFAWEPEQEIRIYFMHQPDLRSPIVDHFYKLGMLPDQAFEPDTEEVTHYCVRLPYDVRLVSIDNSLDLRNRSAQDWLLDLAISGKSGVTFSPAERGGFPSLLPALLSPATGGSSYTDMIGNYLRRIGVNFLVYPSARADCGVAYRNDEIISWKAWNAVDYRGARNLSDIEIQDLRPIEALEQEGNVSIRGWLDGHAKGSWYTEGITEKYRSVRLEELYAEFPALRPSVA